jgi:hypothetical protein
MRNLLLKAIPLFLMISILSCEEGNEVIYEPNAKLIWTGEYDVDGCGFFVEIDSVQYKPENESILPPQYRTSEPIDVTVQYIDLQYEIEFFCGDLPNASKAPAITLTSLDLNQDLP